LEGEKLLQPREAVMTRIRIVAGSVTLEAELEDTPTAHAILEALPCESSASTWGEEVYFEVGVDAKLEPNARQVVDPGTVCYWVQGKSLAIPFGPTPVSQGDECRLVTRVNVVGRTLGDATLLRSVRDGDAIRVEVER
jgi:hypothetical protein